MRKLIIALTLTTLAGCATKPVNVTPSPVSGSKADATVVMGYTTRVGAFISPPIVNWEAANQMANKKCSVWGYSSAERFGDFVNRKCQRSMVNALTGVLECVESLVTVSYQCVD